MEVEWPAKGPAASESRGVLSFLALIWWYFVATPLDVWWIEGAGVLEADGSKELNALLAEKPSALFI